VVFTQLRSISKILHTMWGFNLLSVFQVFPLLIKKFSHKEQADLVWQFLCSIPVNAMAKFLPWLSDSVSPDEHQDIIECLRKVVPEENLLQEVVMIIPITYLLSMVSLFFYSILDFKLCRLYSHGLEGKH
jgi:hypothetical protein